MDVSISGRARAVRNSRDWNQAGKSKLWLYNLHYLDDLNAAGADERYDQLQSLIYQWSRETPMAGNGWEPYPLSPYRKSRHGMVDRSTLATMLN